jgi:hypothetical protein
MEVWNDNDDDDERQGWVIVLLALVAVIFLGLIIWGAIAILAPVIPG